MQIYTECSEVWIEHTNSQSTQTVQWLWTLSHANFHANWSAAQVYVLHSRQFIFALSWRRRSFLQVLQSTEPRATIRSKKWGGQTRKWGSPGICFPNFLKFWDSESVFPGFEGLFNTMICTIKFVIQRLRNEFKVQGQNIRALKGRLM